MTKRQAKPAPTWTDVKARLALLPHASLLDLVRDLYTAHNDTRIFLHARFAIGDNVLAPYKETIQRWLSPDIFRRQDTSVSKAKQALADYRKAVGDDAGSAELMVFYCEQGVWFCKEYGNDDEVYFNSLVRVFAQAAGLAAKMPDRIGKGLFDRLDKVREISRQFGYGVGEEMDAIFVRFWHDS